MLRACLDWIKKLWEKEKPAPQPIIPPPPKRRKVDSEAIRVKISTQGWKLREFPVKKSDPDPAKRQVIQWRMIAIKGDKSMEITGKTHDEAMNNIGKLLGVIPRE